MVTETLRFDPSRLFLSVFLKSQVYANKPQSTDVLKVNITLTMDQIQPDLCSRVIENWTSPIRASVRSCGGHFNDVMFHTLWDKWAFQINHK